MLIAGSDDGVYRRDDAESGGASAARKVLDSGRVMRVRRFPAVEGIFAATRTGLYHSADGERWRDLGVPREQVSAVAVSPDGTRLYAGTRPAEVYVTTDVPGSGGPDAPGNAGGGDPVADTANDPVADTANDPVADTANDPVADTANDQADRSWHELEGFEELPSRDQWRLPRHENLAQVRSLLTHPDAPDRLVAGVEVGGVHVSIDAGETWTERRGTVDDDVHQLLQVGREAFVASTGFGLYRTADAGRTWTRLDDDVEQRYFRMSHAADGVLYASGAGGSSSTWEADSRAALFECDDGETLERVESPRPDEVVVGWTTVDGDVVGATHRGTLLVRRDGEWERGGAVPVPGEVVGRYLPLAWYPR